VRAALLVIGLGWNTSAALAAGVSVEIPEQWATRGRDLDVRLVVRDPIGVIRALEVQLRSPERTWRLQHRLEPGSSMDVVVRVPGDALWSTDPASLDLTVEGLGKRGGLILTAGPRRLEILAPSASDARAQLFRRAPEEVKAAPSPVGVAVGALGRVGTDARVRLYTRIFGLLTRSAELGLTASVGPTFAEARASGPITLGFEFDGRWTHRQTFLTGFAGLDARFPGVDPLVGIGGGFSWGQEVALEVQLDGAGVWFETEEVGFVGTARVGVRFKEGG
jgi:hypothetical protein